MNDTSFKIAVGNFIRISQRLMWETGAILVLVDQFGEGLVFNILTCFEGSQINLSFSGGAARERGWYGSWKGCKA